MVPVDFANCVTHEGLGVQNDYAVHHEVPPEIAVGSLGHSVVPVDSVVPAALTVHVELEEARDARIQQECHVAMEVAPVDRTRQVVGG